MIKILFFLFLSCLSLAGASLAYQLQPKPTSPRYVAARYFPQILAASTSAQSFNLLLLGLDARKGEEKARCDAIHMVSFRPDIGKIIITSVPRGSPAKDNIIANVCSIYDYEVAQTEIEKITEIKADYVIKVGFSQVLGGLRLVGLPTTPTLQMLRNRQYLIGDNQRSYNQAVFLKDMLVSHFETIAKLPDPVKHIGFKLADTSTSFYEAKELLKLVADSGIYKDPDNILIFTAPADNWIRQEIHIEDKVSENTNWQTDPEYRAYQNDVAGYLRNLIKRKDLTKIKVVMDQKLWLQIEDPTLRNQLHFELLQLLPEPALVNDFILEMEQAGNQELLDKIIDVR